MTTELIEKSTRTDYFVELENEYGAHNYHPLDVVIERAEGVWVYDVEGKRYLDCLAAYSAVNQGHCHPKILQTLNEQARKVTLTSRAFRNEQLPLLYKELHDLTGFDMALPMNSGAEAVETAIKTARKWGYKIKGIPQDKAEISSAPIISMDAPSPSSASRLTNNIAMASAHSLRDSKSFPSAMRKPFAQPSRPTPAPSWSSPFKAKPESSFRRQAF